MADFKQINYQNKMESHSNIWIVANITWTHPTPPKLPWNNLFSLVDIVIIILTAEIISSTLLLLLCHFSHVQLCATPETAAHQAPPSLGFSRQKHWSGLPFPSPIHESESDVTQSCPTLRDPMDYSLPGSSVHGIFQARVLEWGATAFSDSGCYMD